MLDQELLEPLRDLPVPPSGLDADQVMTAARRRQRIRRLAGVSSVAAATALVLVTATVAWQRVTVTEQTGAETFVSSCTSSLLPVPESTVGSWVADVDSSGRYVVGGYRLADKDARPLLWDRGELQVLQAPPGHLVGIAVNSAGHVVGQTFDGARWHNWLYRNGAFEQITPAAQKRDDYLQPLDINDRGEVLLESRFDANRMPPKVWHNGNIRDLRVPAEATAVRAEAIDHDGTVVGMRELADGSQRAMRWSPDGEAHDVSAPSGFGPGGKLYAISDGWMLGGFTVADPPQSKLVPVILGPEVRRPNLSTITDINRHGWATGLANGNTAMITDGTHSVELRPPSGARTVMAVYLSHDARTIGGTIDGIVDGLAAARWTCM